MGIAERIDLAVKKRLTERIPKRKIQVAASRIREEMVRMMIARILDGDDIYGKKFKNYVQEYKRFKSRFVRGDVRKNKTLRKLRSDRKVYTANKVSDFMRLTGDLLSDIQSEVLSVSGGGFLTGKIRIKIRIYVGKKNQPKAEGLMRKRKWFGMSKSGRRRKLEQKRITELLVEGLK